MTNSEESGWEWEPPYSMRKKPRDATHFMTCRSVIPCYDIIPAYVAERDHQVGIFVARVNTGYALPGVASIGAFFPSSNSRKI